MSAVLVLAGLWIAALVLALGLVRLGQAITRAHRRGRERLRRHDEKERYRWSYEEAVAHLSAELGIPRKVLMPARHKRATRAKARHELAGRRRAERVLGKW